MAAPFPNTTRVFADFFRRTASILFLASELRLNCLHVDEESFGFTWLKVWRVLGSKQETAQTVVKAVTLVETCWFGTAASSLPPPITHTRRHAAGSSYIFRFHLKSARSPPPPPSSTRQEIKKDFPNIKRGGKCFIISSGCHDFSQEAHNPDFSFISVFHSLSLFLLHLNITLVTGTILVLSELQSERQVHRWI